ncbi:acyl-CoA thioesterase [bacterium]|nr:acyl-CoA thioesterase [bacterium]
MATVFSTEFKVRSYEVDFYNHVNNGVYVNLLEQGRNEFLTQKGISYKDLQEKGIYFVLVHTSINYRSESFIDNILEVTGEVINFGNTSIRVKHLINNKTTGKLAADAEAVIVFTDGKNPISVPEIIKEAFA